MEHLQMQMHKEKKQDYRHKNMQIKIRQQALEIANDPVKNLTMEIGIFMIFTQLLIKKKARLMGFKVKFSIKIPHTSLFSYSDQGRWENVSHNDITTEYFIAVL